MNSESFLRVRQPVARLRRAGLAGLVVAWLAACGTDPGAGEAGSMPPQARPVLGVVALVGIVVNNAIVLIDLVRRLEQDGKSLAEALEAAVGRRTRPILMTTVTTVAGLLPLTITRSTLWPPLAWAIISGLIASTLLTLVVIPALHRLLMQRNIQALDLGRGTAQG